MDRVLFQATTMNVRADGKRCRIDGKPQAIGRKTAEELVARSVGEIVDPADEGSDPDERVTTIAKAVEGLGEADWTSGGTPKVSAVAKASGLADVTAEELAGFKKPEA